MRYPILNKFIGTLCLLLYIALEISAQNTKPFVIPELKEWKGKEGYFVPNSQLRIIYNEPALQKIAETFADDYHALFGIRPQIAQGKVNKGDFFLTLKTDRKLGKEGYTIDITDYVKVSAPETAGIYWGTRTLLQIGEQNDNHQLPKGLIRDFPDYSMRGFMIDCGRKYIPINYLRDLAKVLSYYKMNVLHVHLNDNGFKQFFNHDWDKTYAAFRLECETFPGLTARDGYYTKQEFIEFQDEATTHFVEIIPEIDVPAHTLAFSHYKPEIGSKQYGMDHLDLSNPETYTFLDALFKEYLEGEEPVFRGPRVHIGTDEYSNKDKEVVEQFRAFTDHYIRYVESFGKKACVWGALTHAPGETPVKVENVDMFTWNNNFANPREMAKLGYKQICIPDWAVYIVPLAPYYHDYLDNKYLYEEWTPAHVGKVMFDEKDPAILGGMFAVWNDLVGNGISVKDIHHRVFPSLQTMAMKTWNANPLITFDIFDSNRMALSEAPGVNQLGRIGDKPGLVYETANVQPGAKLPFPEIGYNYTVTFDLDAQSEALGTELFRSPDAVFYLSDPVSGLFGFARDGYLNTFGFSPYPGEKINVRIEGDPLSTSLYINGKLFKKLDVQMQFYNSGKDSMKYIRTLVFPLEKAGNFKSRITNLKVYNHIPK